MLFELAIGDAYGAGFEFSPREKIRKYNNLTAYQRHEKGIPPGRYTDDTQMSLALAELLIEGVEWTRENIADAFVNCFKRDSRPGYSTRLYSLLSEVESGRELLARINPDSIRNGAAMRAASLGFIADRAVLLERAALQATITHDTEIGVKSAQAVALMAHYFIHEGGVRASLSDYVSEHTAYQWLSDWNQPVACDGFETVNAVLTVLSRASSLREVLLQSVAFSGDVDTVAAVSAAVASLSDEYEPSLPDFLIRDLEDGAYGASYLKQLDERLMGASAI